MTAGSVLAPTIIPIKLPFSGKSINTIDENTLIELRCETPETDIYFTVDGSKPNLYTWVGSSDKRTKKYKYPFTMKQGRRTVRAIALDKINKRESLMVTKTFHVEKHFYTPEEIPVLSVPPIRIEVDDSMKETDADKITTIIAAASSECTKIESNWEANNNNKKHRMSLGEITELSKTTPGEMPKEKVSSTEDLQSKKDPIIEEDKKIPIIDESSDNEEVTVPQAINNNKSSDLPPDNKHNGNSHCICFCCKCGHHLSTSTNQVSRFPLLTQMGTCPDCHSYVPVNLPFCTACDVPLNTFSNIKEGKSLESLVPTSQVIPHNRYEYLCCDTCGRVNSKTARFCDWCGERLSAAMESLLLECSFCLIQNQAFSRFCHACGYYLMPPSNVDIKSRLRYKEDKAVEVKTGMQDCDAQTDGNGLFKTKIDKAVNTCIKKEAFQKTKLHVSAVSPGQGYWRQQIDHIVSHLKTLAYNDPEFRSQLAEPKLTKLSTAKVYEGLDDLTISLTFALKRETETDKLFNREVYRPKYSLPWRLGFAGR